MIRTRGDSEAAVTPGWDADSVPPTSWNRTDYAVAALVGLAALGAFLPVLSNGFAQHWDDQTNFLQNPSFRGIGWQQLRWAWTTTLQAALSPWPGCSSSWSTLPGASNRRAIMG